MINYKNSKKLLRVKQYLSIFAPQNVIIIIFILHINILKFKVKHQVKLQIWHPESVCYTVSES